nr:Gfo/Idh/MocA family oxidoreductase [Clostridia bacterium]
MSTFKPIKVGIMGFKNGHVTGMFDAMRFNPMFEVVAVSFDAKTRNLLEERYGDARLFDKYDVFYNDADMVKSHPELELCVCGGSNAEHMGQFRLCAENKINAIMMKVPTLNIAEYDEMLRLEKESGIKVSIELEMRWYAAVERVKSLIKSGVLGEITAINAYNYSHFPLWWNKWMNQPKEIYGSVVPLRAGDSRFRGGAMTDHPHLFDLVRYITESEFESVYTEVAPNMRENSAVEDMVYIIGRMKNGVIVSLDPSYANREYEQSNVIYAKDRLSHYPKSVQVEMSVCGTKGGIISDLYNPNTTEQLRFEDYEYRVNPRFYDISGTRKMYMEEFARAIRGGTEYKPAVSMAEHKKTMQVINACYESISTGKPVNL